ncbi:MAG TPA: hypothetical protein VF760_08465, partial [Xanthobacteraceae bacterium]
GVDHIATDFITHSGHLEPVTRPRPVATSSIGGICKFASVDRNASTSYALRKAGPERQFGY